MQAHRPTLAALEQRLHGLLQSLDNQEPSIKSEPLNIDPSIPSYVCAECAWTTSKRQGLALHFAKKHNPSIFACPVNHCKQHCSSQWGVDKHFQQYHTIPWSYPGCEAVFPGTSQLHNQLEKEHPPGDSSSPGNGSSDSSGLFECPWPGCRRRFPDNTALLNHYDYVHPLSIYQPDNPKPYKCPFCLKAYTSERYMRAHQSSSHRRSRWAPPHDDGSPVDQQALIRESHESMIRRVSQLPSRPSASIDGSSNESDEPKDGGEEYSITIIGGRIYVDDELALSSPESENFDMLKTGDSAPPKVSAPRDEKMAIGYLVQPLSTDHMMTDANDADDYPERFALDEDDLPREPYHSSSIHVTDQFADLEQGRRILGRILYILHLYLWVGVGELMALWSTLLTSQHRITILQQLHNIDVDEGERKLLSALHGSILSEIINAWAQFKLLPLQYFPESFPRDASAKETISAILGYCKGLENLINEGHPAAMAQGYKVPELLRRPPRDDSSISGDASLVRLIEALAERVKCRIVHHRWIDFTNVMILKETGPYIQDLKTVVGAIYPGGAEL